MILIHLKKGNILVEFSTSKVPLYIKNDVSVLKTAEFCKNRI